MNRIELTGKYNRLTIVKPAPSIGGRSASVCLCDCGNTTIVANKDIKRGNTTSCGCYQSERRKTMNVKHGKSKTRTYHVWQTMKARCKNPSSKSYSRYGAMGIIVCDRWKEDNGYENFIEDMGEAPTEKHQIDRKDPAGNYEPSNCRWATIIEQANNKRSNVILEHGGKKYRIQELADELDTTYMTIYGLLDRGKSVQDIFNRFNGLIA